MDRKRFLQAMAGLTLSAVGVPVVAGCRRSGSSGERAAPPARRYRIGYLVARVGDAQWSGPAPELVAALAARGYREGEAIQFEFREGNDPREYRRLAGDLVRLPVDVIVVLGELVSRAAMDATPTIPIFMMEASDQVEFGLCASLN